MVPTGGPAWQWPLLQAHGCNRWVTSVMCEHFGCSCGKLEIRPGETIARHHERRRSMDRSTRLNHGSRPDTRSVCVRVPGTKSMDRPAKMKREMHTNSCRSEAHACPCPVAHNYARSTVFSNEKELV